QRARTAEREVDYAGEGTRVDAKVNKGSLGARRSARRPPARRRARSRPRSGPAPPCCAIPGVASVVSMSAADRFSSLSPPPSSAVSRLPETQKGPGVCTSRAFRLRRLFELGQATNTARPRAREASRALGQQQLVASCIITGAKIPIEER